MSLILPETFRSTSVTKEFSIAVRAAECGAEIIQGFFEKGFEVRGKESHNLVTDADIQSERAIVETIQGAFPGHAVLGEEFSQADVTAKDLWIVDPLDGTNNFAHRIPHFAVSVAYYRDGIAQCGVIYNPIRNDGYVAQLGKGAFHNGRPLQVVSADRLDQVIIGCGFYYDRGAMMEATLGAIGDLFRQQIHGIRRFGTASLDLCQVAAGQFGGAFEFELAPWDFAAGRLIVEEAGGRVTQCDGSPLPLSNTDILASNTQLHEPMKAVILPHRNKLPRS